MDELFCRGRNIFSRRTITVTGRRAIIFAAQTARRALVLLTVCASVAVVGLSPMVLAFLQDAHRPQFPQGAFKVLPNLVRVGLCVLVNEGVNDF